MTEKPFYLFQVKNEEPDEVWVQTGLVAVPCLEGCTDTVCAPTCFWKDKNVPFNGVWAGYVRTEGRKSK